MFGGRAGNSCETVSSPVLPIALRAGSAHALVVGAGDAALRKVRGLLAAGFQVTVVAPSAAAPFHALAQSGEIRLCERAFGERDLEDCAFVIVATNDREVNARATVLARERRLIVCDAADARAGDFTMMAVHRIGDLTLALDSGGSSPSFSRRMLGEIAAAFGQEYAGAARTLARIRAEVRTRLPLDERIALLKELSALPVRELADAPDRTRVVCASRSSALAREQTRSVAASLVRRGIATEILDVTTAGDRDQRHALHALGETNVFVKELELALRDGRADYAVHSAKDLPSDLETGMRIAAVSPREDARDAFCSERYASFDALPAGAVVGTSSLRRRFQLQALRPDLTYSDVRGNVDTRLRKLRDGEYDAVILAMAGLRRLGVHAAYTTPFAPDVLVPAAGQGALAVETRAQDALLCYELRAAVNDSSSELCVRCERAVLRALHAGCSSPIGVHATMQGTRLQVLVSLATPEQTLRETHEGTVRCAADAEVLGDALGRRLAQRYRGTLEVNA